MTLKNNTHLNNFQSFEAQRLDSNGIIRKTRFV